MQQSDNSRSRDCCGTCNISGKDMVGVPFKVCLPSGQLVGVVAYNFAHLGQVLKTKFGLGRELNFSLDDGTLICDQDYFELLPPQTKLNVSVQPDGAERECSGLRSTPNAAELVTDLRITNVAGNVSMSPQLMSPPSNYIPSPPPPGFVLSPEGQYVNMIELQRQKYRQAHLEQVARLHQRNIIVHPRHVYHHQHPMPVQPGHGTIYPVVPCPFPVPVPVRHHQTPHRTQCRFETPVLQHFLNHRRHHQQNQPIQVRRELSSSPNTNPPTLLRMESQPELIPGHSYHIAAKDHKKPVPSPNVSPHISTPTNYNMNNNMVPCVSTPQDMIYKVGRPPAQSTMATTSLSKEPAYEELVKLPAAETVSDKVMKKETGSPPPQSISVDRPLLMTDELRQLVTQSAVHTSAVTDQIQNRQSSVVPPPTLLTQPTENVIIQKNSAVETEDSSEDEGELYIDETACSTPVQSNTSSPSATSVKCRFFERSTPEETDDLLQTVKTEDESSAVSEISIPSAVQTDGTSNDSVLALDIPSHNAIGRLPFADFDSDNVSANITPADNYQLSCHNEEGSQDCVNEVVSSDSDMDANTLHTDEQHDRSFIVSYQRVSLSPQQEEAVCLMPEKSAAIQESINMQTDEHVLNFDQSQPAIEGTTEGVQDEELTELKVSIHTLCIDGQVYVDHCSYRYNTGDNNETSSCESAAEFDDPPQCPLLPVGHHQSHHCDTSTSTQRISMSEETLSSQMDYNTTTQHPPLELAKYASEEITVTRPRYCSTAEVERCSAEILAVALEQYTSISRVPLGVDVPVEESVLVDSSTIPSSVEEEDGVCVDSLLEDGDFFKNDFVNGDSMFSMDLSEESEDDVFHFEDDTTIINEVTLPLDIYTEPPTPSGRRLVLLSDQDDSIETEVVEMDCNFQASSVPLAEYCASLSTYGYDPNACGHPIGKQGH